MIRCETPLNWLNLLGIAVALAMDALAVSIVAGLLILGLATFRPIMYFGLLVCFTLAATCLGTIVVLPAVLALGAKRKAGARLG